MLFRSPRRTDVRIIAATNEDLDHLIEKRMFRKDLYYRIRGAWLHLPPLRERRDDIPLLINELFKRNGDAAQGRRAIDEEALDALLKHDYPGNIRELESILHSARNLAQGQAITLNCLQDHLQVRKKTPPRDCRMEDPGTVTLAEAERCHILKIYAHTGNNKTQSAKLLDIGLNTLRRKLRAYGVEQEEK